MIDGNDRDARLPPPGIPHDLYVDKLARLSIILGRMPKAVYRYGISSCTPVEIYLINPARLG
jgi:hypothetical protein